MEKVERAETSPMPGMYWLPAVFLASASVMAIELALTRLFSALLWYHFVFIAVSLTIFGLALGGLLIYRSARIRSLGTLLLTLAGGAVILMVATFNVLPLAKVWPLYLLFSLPALVIIGAFQSLAFKVHDRPGRLYFADLLGAALGAGLSLAAIRYIPVPSFVATVAVILTAAGTGLGLIAKGARLRCNLALGGAVAVMLGVTLATGLWEAQPSSQLGSGKQMAAAVTNGGRILWTRWNEMSRVDVVDLQQPSSRFIFTDGGAVSEMYRFDGSLDSVSALKQDNGFFPLANGTHGKIAIIGAGGGKDVLISLLAGANEVTAIEINRGVLDAMRRFKDYNGGLYERPDVRLVAGDGRRYLENTAQRFDAIYLPLVMTQAADSIGLGLVENYTFTREAFRTYLRKLTPDGRLILKLHDPTDLAKAVLTAVQVLAEKTNEAEATRHLYILNGRGHQGIMYPVLVVEKAALSQADCDVLLKRAAAAGFASLYFPHHLEQYLPGMSTGKLTTAQAIASAPINVRPVTDDQPFFYNYDRGIPRILLALLFVVAAGAILLLPRGAQEDKKGNCQRMLERWYFAGLGLAFMLIEVAFIQKSSMLLAMPTLAAAAVIVALLIGGALGSLTTSRQGLAEAAKRRPLCLALAGITIAVYMFAYAPVSRALLASPGDVMPYLLGLFFLPLGFVMGMPFPLGLRLLKAFAPEEVPMAWAVNGAFSVVGSVLAMALATAAGFTFTILVGCLLYGAMSVISSAPERVSRLSQAVEQKMSQERRLAYGLQAQGKCAPTPQPR